MNTGDDELVADYLRRLREAVSTLPADRRDELLEEITAHIAEARAIGPAEGSDPAAHVADILARLGGPEAIVEAAGPGGAAEGEPGGFGPGGYGAGGGLGGGATAWPQPQPRSRLGGHEIAAVILLLIGGLVAGLGWIAGVVLLWTSPRWRVRDKVLGTLIWPFGLVAPLLILGALVAAGVPAKSVCVGTSVSSAVTMSGPGGQVYVGNGHVVITTPGGKVSVREGGTGTSARQHNSRGISLSRSCTQVTGGASGWLTALLVIALLLSIIGPVLMAILLLRHAGRQPAGPARASPPAIQPT